MLYIVHLSGLKQILVVWPGSLAVKDSKEEEIDPVHQ